MCEIHNANCFDIFPKIKDHSVDLFILDLPYNQTACTWDKEIIDLNLLWKHLKRIGKHKTCYIFLTTTKFGHKVIESNKAWFRYDLVYEKTVALGFFHANQMPLRSHEMIYVFYKKLPTFNPQKTPGIPYYKSSANTTNIYTKHCARLPTKCEDGSRYPKSVLKFSNGNYKSKHPCSKPIKLMEYLIKSYSKENDVVCDPFMGIASCGKACKLNNRKYIGIELDATFYKICMNNLQ